MELQAITAAASWEYDTLASAFAHYARAASPAVVDAIWQGAAVAAVLFIALRLAPRISAAHRFAAWVAGFAAVAGLPFLPVAAHLFAGKGAVASSAPAAVATRAWLQLDTHWALIIAALWLVASALRLAQLMFHLIRLRRLWKTAKPVAGVPLAYTAPVCTTDQLDRPSVIGFFAPRILIPHWLYARLTPQELRQVVLHEIEHLRRHDDWTNLIQKLVLVLFPLNPALAWIERRLCREREMACDEGVIRATQAPRAYAACLAGLAEYGLDRETTRRAEALSLAAWRRRSELVHRVHGILWRKPTLSSTGARLLLGTVACGLLAGSVELARCPQAVAFVAAPQPQQMAQADGVIAAQAAFRPVTLAANMPSAHMVPAVAILPDVSSAARVGSIPAAAHRTTQRPAATSDTEIASRDAVMGVPHESYLTAEIPAGGRRLPAQAEGATQSQPQYFVLTAVEQVQALPQSRREIADYDTGAAAQHQSANQGIGIEQNSNPDNKTAEAAAPQIVVTRLIFRIAPLPTQANPAAGSGKATGDRVEQPTSKSQANSHAVEQPAVIPFANGWLVLQL